MFAEMKAIQRKQRLDAAFGHLGGDLGHQNWAAHLIGGLALRHDVRDALQGVGDVGVGLAHAEP